MILFVALIRRLRYPETTLRKLSRQPIFPPLVSDPLLGIQVFVHFLNHFSETLFYKTCCNKANARVLSLMGQNDFIMWIGTKFTTSNPGDISAGLSSLQEMFSLWFWLAPELLSPYTLGIWRLYLTQKEPIS